MPTKPLVVTPSLASPPFYTSITSNGACEPSFDSTLSREEQAYFPDQNQRGLPAYAAMCRATTVQSLNANWPSPSVILGSRAGLRHVVAGVETFPVPTIYTSGVADQSFTRTATTPVRALHPFAPTSITNQLSGAQSLSGNVTYAGLPVIGVTMMRYVNGVVPVGGIATLSNYGGGSTVKTFADVSTQ